MYSQKMTLVILCAILVTSRALVQSTVANSVMCDFYHPKNCDKETPDEQCHTGSSCDPANNNRAFCFAEWTNSSGRLYISKKGCWADDEACVGKKQCVENHRNPGTYHCCCEGDFCNNDNHLSYLPIIDTPAPKMPQRCEYYDPLECKKNKSLCDQKMITCEQPDPGKKVHCYASWKNVSGEIEFLKKGCWLDHHECYVERCVGNLSHNKEVHMYFCCCNGDSCNVDVEQAIAPEYVAPEEKNPEKSPQNPKSQVLKTLLYSLLPISITALTIAIVFYVWRRRKCSDHEPLSQKSDLPDPPIEPSPTIGLRPLQLLEVKARGRFGCVWKAQLLSELVAVKVFPMQDKGSWMAEKDIYNLPYFKDSQHILHYIGAERRGNSLGMELWLISEFHEKGSLYDFLKGNLVSWKELLRLAESMAAGVAFLHEDISLNKLSPGKPAVAHRDLKSKNVLVKNDLSACIADFGLALQFQPGMPVGDTHGQVGTRRYMAPEVLEGAINFSRDSFLRIDMYAMGLLLWELLSRCSAADGPVAEYRLPLEEEVGQHPTLEDMQEAVVQRNYRPLLRPHWRQHQGLDQMCETVEECWDHDPEARLSAGCVEERIVQLRATEEPSSLVPCVLVSTESDTIPKESSI